MKIAKTYAWLLLRIAHGVFVCYFLVCLAYIYFAVLTERYDMLLVLAVVSLGIEGIMVFGLNKGNCPLVHVQKRVGDEKPFFELFLPPKLASIAIPVFALLTLVPIAVLICNFAVLK